MNTSTDDKPKRGRPCLYPPEQRELAYKQKHKIAQQAHYELHKEDSCNKAKLQGQIYRHAYKLLKDIWKERQIHSEKFNPLVKSLIEDKQVIDY
jgi:hypothetical protein